MYSFLKGTLFPITAVHNCGLKILPKCAKTNLKIEALWLQPETITNYKGIKLKNKGLDVASLVMSFNQSECTISEYSGNATLPSVGYGLTETHCEHLECLFPTDHKSFRWTRWIRFVFIFNNLSSLEGLIYQLQPSSEVCLWHWLLLCHIFNRLSASADPFKAGVIW